MVLRTSSVTSDDRRPFNLLSQNSYRQTHLSGDPHRSTPSSTNSLPHLSGLLCRPLKVCLHLVPRMSCYLGNRLFKDRGRLSNGQSCVQVHLSSLQQREKKKLVLSSCLSFFLSLTFFSPFLRLTSSVSAFDFIGFKFCMCKALNTVELRSTLLHTAGYASVVSFNEV